MSLQPSATSFATQPYLHFPSLKSNSDGRSSIHSLEKTHLSKNDVIRLVMDKDKPVFPVKAKFETGRPAGVPPSLSSPLLKRKREQLVDEQGVEEEVARNVSKILSATRAAQNLIPPPTKNNITSSADPSWNNLKSTSSSPKPIYCDLCSKNFPSQKSFRSHSCRASTETISSSTSSTLNATLNLSQILQTTSVPIELNRFNSSDIPSSLITPDVSSYESSPPSETASMDECNGVALDAKVDNSPDGKELSPISNPSNNKIVNENKWCPDCGKVLCSTSNLKRHRASCKYAVDIKDEPLDSLPKWVENKSQSWLQLSVGEHLKAKHLGLSLNVGNEGKEEKGCIGVTPSIEQAIAQPVAMKEEIVTTIDKEGKNELESRLSFECTVCSKQFSCRKNVRRHMMAIHKITPPPGAPLGVIARSINNNRITISRSSEESLDGYEKEEEMAKEDSRVQMDTTNNAVPITDTVAAEKDGEKKKINKTENRIEKTIPLDFTLQCGNKRMRLDVIREEDRAVITAQSVKFNVSRLGAMKASPLLASLLCNTRDITLDIPPTSLKNLLLVYSDNSKLNLDNIVCVSELSLKLKVNQIKNLCEKFITAELPKLSLMRAIRLADMYKLVKLKDELFESLSIDVLRTIAIHEDYREMRPELKAELLDKFGEFL